ncbi:hypothetical protein [Glycomyces tenuis]|uniref:rhamnogalacturonan lyase family protein n=1 Tax=Glycomyces tenuis TaxID=58116 RepID=UPI001B7FF00F|nr:hypothetical protein [Glycomyces tenuis]
MWVGDLDGDGAYDYVVDRQTSPQSIEAYSSDGEFLREVDMGHNSTNQNNIEGGSSTIDVGHNDGVTVYDFDSDGFAEVAVRIADGVTFGDGGFNLMMTAWGFDGGDVFGEWREEVVLPNGEYDELIVFTTDRPTDIRLYTLAHNPAYRNDMTVKGYMQSHHVDYFLGHDMDTPARPDITY